MQIDSCFCIKDFQFRVSLVSEDGAVLEKTDFPFSVVTDSDPLARLIEAGFLTGAGSELNKVFLLVQRDRYLPAEDELRPVTNRDIEESWQNAFSFYAENNHGLILLSGQTDERGRLIPFPPLFFCKTRRIFFHPPCPKCGLPLQQCEDDGLLDGSGLQPYSGSLRRYLYCPQCASTGRLDFYAYEEEPAAPPAVRDRRALIRKFRLLAEGAKNAGRLPCMECPNHKECYGTDQRAVSRIVPFSFYPFYMFTFKAMSLNALDFLSLVSGADFQELESELEKKQETGRINCLENIRQDKLTRAPFLFDSDERYFLEALYLKLSFLGEVIQYLSRGNDPFMHPGLKPSLERIWVSLPEHGNLLPFLWSFRVNLIDIFSHRPEGRSFPELPGSGSLFYMGLVWFCAMLANSRQDVSKVHIALREIMDQCLTGKDFSFRESVKEGLNPAFSPVNIFRYPEGKIIPEDFLPLWDKTLDLAWSLLRTGFHPDPAFSMENLLQQSEDLRKDVRAAMFSEAPVEKPPAQAPENDAVHDILRNIYNKWSAATVDVEKESTETVILSPSGPEKEAAPSAPPKEDSEVIEETVIISGKDTGHSPKPDEKESSKPDSVDFLEETVILKPGKPGDKGKDGAK